MSETRIEGSTSRVAATCGECFGDGQFKRPHDWPDSDPMQALPCGHCKETGMCDCPKCDRRTNCPTCGQKVGNLKTAAEKKEAEFSGMCSFCQDAFFGKEAHGGYYAGDEYWHDEDDLPKLSKPTDRAHLVEHLKAEHTWTPDYHTPLFENEDASGPNFDYDGVEEDHDAEHRAHAETVSDYYEDWSHPPVNHRHSMKREAAVELEDAVAPISNNELPEWIRDAQNELG